MAEPRRVDLGTCSKCDDHNNPCVCRAGCDCEGHGDRRSLPDQGGSPAVAYIARCPEHGLHGERDDCFVCGEPVAMIGYVRADLHLQVHSARGRHEADARRLRAEVETLRGEVMARDGVIRDRDTENERLTKALREIEGSPRAGIGCDQQVIARTALNQYRSARTSDEIEYSGFPGKTIEDGQTLDQQVAAVHRRALTSREQEDTK